ncbi:hypothetical protein [Labilibaculum antarcticum]|uniref:Host attachment protein n=1 Tax=Labilibaculum antarcticum TaxID=1717717 RepID=A0A1Y1CL89_9BACT|nr:hypothetical protein [Labilibaculum antarcticum]BAX80041.1 hypothetical protein ALGA_1666 [Labilibaculum antarcticum]
MKISKKKLGVWMDHTIAHIIEINKNTITSKTIESLSLQGENQNFGKDESLKHNTEKGELSEFFKRLREVIKDYSEVILFGPTNAKIELHNLLKEDSHFNNIKIDTETADNLTENQMHAFVKEHFENNINCI